MRQIRSILLLAAASLPGPALPAQQSPPPADCSSEKHRAFDFWVGDWEVTSNGRLAGSNSITLSQNGCLLHEHWTGARGETGESFNFYDRSTDRWYQVWIDGRGSVLRLSGEAGDNTMRLEGETKGAQGIAQQRITWTRNADGTVRQLWESSRDGGATWTVAFDGTYRKR